MAETWRLVRLKLSSSMLFSHLITAASGGTLASSPYLPNGKPNRATNATVAMRVERCARGACGVQACTGLLHQRAAIDNAAWLPSVTKAMWVSPARWAVAISSTTRS